MEQYKKSIEYIESDLKKLQIELNLQKEDFKNERMKNLFYLGENIANNIRLLPYYSERDPIDFIQKEINDHYMSKGYKVEVDEEHVCISMPILIPKKEGQNPNYIKEILTSLLSEYFRERQVVPEIFYEKMFLVVENIYSNTRKVKDHTNIELNAVEDILASYFLLDDNGLKLSHIFLSKIGERDQTNLYLIKEKDILNFLSERIA